MPTLRDCALMVSTLVDYWMGLEMGKRSSPAERRPFLVLSLIVNLGLLCAFKYLGFLCEVMRLLLYSLNLPHELPVPELLLPVGISFYTFQTLSYSIDVYRGDKEPEKHLGRFALYVSFFPQLVAGPIERSRRLLPQFYKEHPFDITRVSNGLRQMLWGFFKKLVIANRLGVYVDAVYDNPADSSGIAILIATYFFAFQIYCDFSGYSDIAIGTARILGYDLMENFRRPYFSTSIREFWSRWHISLSTWFRDYLYIPLGGNRGSTTRWFLNIFLVFLLSGLWHGANSTFLEWGALHGTYFILFIGLSRFLHAVGWPRPFARHPRIRRALAALFTFHLVLFAWIFFRANSVSDAAQLIGRMACAEASGVGILGPFSARKMAIAVGAILFMELVHLCQGETDIATYVSERPLWIRWATYYALIFAILCLGVFDQSPFIYFQF
ncbi:MBOAT family O-acyltransferase [Planctomycetota bacterium]